MKAINRSRCETHPHHLAVGQKSSSSKRWTVGADLYNHVITGEKSMTISGSRADEHHIPCVIIGDCYTLDEKMGQTYIHENVANALAARDYKQPQAVVYRVDDGEDA